MAEEKKTEYHDCILYGYLEKKSLHLKQFRKRWIEIKSDDRLYLCKDEIDKAKPREIIDLTTFDSVITSKQLQLE